MKKYLTLTLLPAMIPSAAVAQERPNVIFIVADDLDYGDLSCNGCRRLSRARVSSSFAFSAAILPQEGLKNCLSCDCDSGSKVAEWQQISDLTVL